MDEKIQKLVDRANKSDRKEELSLDIFDVCGVDSCYVNYDQLEKVFHEKYFRSWICTDTRVGGSIVFLLSIPVAIRVKLGRKSDSQFYWIGGADTYARVKQILNDMSLPEEFKIIEDADVFDEDEIFKYY